MKYRFTTGVYNILSAVKDRAQSGQQVPTKPISDSIFFHPQHTTRAILMYGNTTTDNRVRDFGVVQLCILLESMAFQISS